MKKVNTTLFCLATIGVTVFGLIWQNYFLGLLVSLNEPYVQLRLLLVIVLSSYVYFYELRTRGFKLLLQLGAILLLIFSISALFSPTVFGFLSHYVLIGDVFIFLEGGIIALLLATELPISQKTAHTERAPYKQKLRYSMGTE